MEQEEYKEFLRQQNIRIRENINRIKHRIVVFSGKGGVGKTSVSVNLACALSDMGETTGLVDADVTGPNVSIMTGMKSYLESSDSRIVPCERKNLKAVSFAGMIPDGEAVIWRGPMRSKLLNSFLADVEWGSLNYLIADLPPGTGDEIMTITEKMNPELALIVTTPQEVSLIDSERAINMARKLKIPRIALIENMAGLICPKCGELINLFGCGGGIKQAKKMNTEFFGSVPIVPEFRVLADIGKPIVWENPESAVSKIFFELADIIRISMN